MIFPELIASARAVPIENELGRRGIQLRGRIERCGACPRCGGSDRFSINTSKQLWHCRRCKPVGIAGDIIGLVQWFDDCDFATAVRVLAGEATPNAGSNTQPRIPERRNNEASHYEQNQHKKAAWLWLRRRPIAGSPVEKYLREVRGIGCALPPSLAYLAPTKPQHYPALMSAFGVPEEIEPGVLVCLRNVNSVHLTLLKPDGSGKAEVETPRLIVGRPFGRPIAVAPVNDLGGLAVTESIEDGLSVFEATGLGVFAAGSAGMMPALAALIPDHTEALTIFAHRDRSGEDGALGLAAELEDRNIEVRIEGLLP